MARLIEYSVQICSCGCNRNLCDSELEEILMCCNCEAIRRPTPKVCACVHKKLKNKCCHFKCEQIQKRKYCKDCVFRNKEGFCEYRNDNSWAGEYFGCIHWTPKA